MVTSMQASCTCKATFPALARPPVSTSEGVCDQQFNKVSFLWLLCFPQDKTIETP